MLSQLSNQPNQISSSSAGVHSAHDKTSLAMISSDNENKELLQQISFTLAHPETIQVFFMQIVNLRNGSIRGFEALANVARLPSTHQPYEGWVELASKTETIRSVDEIALKVALSGHLEHLSLLRQLRIKRPIFITSNLHPQSLNYPDTAERVIEIVKQSGAEPARVILELTEQEPLTDLGVEQVKILARYGFPIYYDGFGKEAATEEAARILPLSGVKIDVETTREVGTDTDTHPCESTAARKFAAARRLGVKRIVAEGSERELQVAMVYDYGATDVQGWLFSQKCTLGQSLVQLQQNIARPWSFF